MNDKLVMLALLGMIFSFIFLFVFPLYGLISFVISFICFVIFTCGK